MVTSTLSHLFFYSVKATVMEKNELINGKRTQIVLLNEQQASLLLHPML